MEGWIGEGGKERGRKGGWGIESGCGRKESRKEGKELIVKYEKGDRI